MASLRKRGLLLIWPDRDITRLAPRHGSPGRPAVVPEATIQVCLTFNRLFKCRPADRAMEPSLSGTQDARRCHTAIIDRQATAIIPIRLAFRNRLSVPGTAETVRVAGS